MNEMNVFC